MKRNEIYLQKSRKLLVPTPDLCKENSPSRLVATFQRNIGTLGFTFSRGLFRSLSKLSTAQLEQLHNEVVPVLRKMKGAHVQYNPMYPNFPQQVMDMSTFELYFNAIMHYWTGGKLIPFTEKEDRLPLFEDTQHEVLDVGTEKDFKSILTNLLGARTSISESDKEVVRWFISNEKFEKLLPEEIFMKENVALLAGTLLKNNPQSGGNAQIIKKYVKTPTDVLRVAVGLSGGDISLATNTKFANMSRSTRKLLLTLLEQSNTELAEEMKKYRNVWVKLGERLHPGEYAKQYPRGAAAFNAIRNEKIETFGTRVETGLLKADTLNVCRNLKARPGEFARRLDHIIRITPKRSVNRRVDEFLQVADKVSTPLLLQLHNHFSTRSSEQVIRPVFPKGSLAKVVALPEKLEPLDSKLCDKLVFSLHNVLVSKYKERSKMGKVYIDEALKNYLVPFSQRSAARALRTIVRGSRVPLDGDYDTVRFFIWWKNIEGDRTDVDLSAGILNADFGHIADVSYYNLRDFCGHHSGDITNAPNGASEFIDISLSAVVKGGGRYIAPSIYNYSQAKYSEMTDCFAGWMGRAAPKSGEIYEPTTVKNRMDLTAESTIALPFLIDCVERKVIWCDLSVKSRSFCNSYRQNFSKTQIALQSIVHLQKPNVYDLLSMNAEGRGKIVKDRGKADVVFDEEFAFQLDTIAKEYL